MNTDDEKYNEKSWNETHEAYQTARVEGFIPAEWEFEDYLLAEVKRLREELKQTRESLWWCYDNYRFDSHTMVDADWDFIGNLLGADMESEEE